MLRKLRRANRTNRPKTATARQTQSLQVEPLENRLLLNAGWWDELGWRSASGAGISDDNNADPGDVQLVLSSDGDPVALWINGDSATGPTRVGSPTTGRIPYHWEVSGTIEAAQYVGGDQGWVDLSSAEQSIGNGTELAAAAGPNGEIIAAWVSGSEIVAASWDGARWTNFAVSGSDAGTVHEKPDIAIIIESTLNLHN